MKVQIIKKPIPEEIYEGGGASVQIVNKETVELETSVDEAKDALIVVGDKLLIKGMFVGLFKSMIKGIERDGNARQLGDFITLYPVPTGEFDLDKGWQEGVNEVRIRARLMNEMEIDISKWEFEDSTPGRQSFKLESVKGGSVDGVIESNKAVEMNGRNLPLTADIRVDWALEDGSASGTIAAAKVTSTVTRVDIAADAMSAIVTQANDGKTIVFTVRGNYANAKISAVLKYVAPVATPHFTSATGAGQSAGTVAPGAQVTITGTGLRNLTAGEKVTLTFFSLSAEVTGLVAAADGLSMTGTVGEMSGYEPGGDANLTWADADQQTITSCSVKLPE